MVQVCLTTWDRGYRLQCSGHATEGTDRENTAVCAAASMLFSLVEALAQARGGCVDTSRDGLSELFFTADGARDAAETGFRLLAGRYPHSVVLQGPVA